MVLTVLPSTAWAIGAFVDIFGSFPGASTTISVFYRFASRLPAIEIKDGFLISLVLFDSSSYNSYC